MLSKHFSNFIFSMTFEDSHEVPKEVVTNINKTYINIVYPINYDKGNKYIEQIIGINRIDLDPATHINFQVYLEKNIFITDDEIFSGKNHTKTILELNKPLFFLKKIHVIIHYLFPKLIKC